MQNIFTCGSLIDKAILTKHLAEMSYKKLSVVVCSLFFLYYIAVSPICDEERRGCSRSFMASYRRCALYMHSNVANIMWQYCLIELLRSRLKTCSLMRKAVRVLTGCYCANDTGHYYHISAL